MMTEHASMTVIVIYSAAWSILLLMSVLVLLGCRWILANNMNR